MATQYRAVASITKAHGNKGKVVATPVVGLPFVLVPGMRICLVPPNLKGDRFHSVEAVETSGTGQLLHLSGIKGRDDAEAVRGKTILVAIDDLPDDFALHDVRSLIGRTVTDELKQISGVLVEVAQTPANDVWYVETPKGEMALPVIESVVSDIAATGTIRVSIPNGLEPGGGDEE